MIKFSIITITYNAAPVFSRTADSVLHQHYRNVEHIIIDGASTDKTLALAKDYMERSYAASNGHDIRIVSEPDNGIYDAMNKGVAQASGDYICFLNAGDSLPSADTLDKIVANADLSKTQAEGFPLPAVLYGDTHVVDGDGRFLHRRRLSPPEHLTWRSFRHGMLVCHQAFYVRTDIAREVPYNLQYKYSADVDWCIRIMRLAGERGLQLKNVHAVLANYLQEGTTTRHHKESLKERFHIMCHYYGTFSTMCMHLWFAVRNIIN